MPGSGIESHRFREGLVNRPAREHLHPIVDAGLTPLGGRRRLQAGACGEDRQSRHAAGEIEPDTT
jgi:hypothetical protein